MKKLHIVTPLALALAVAFAGAGSAAPGITMTSPADGAIVSRGATPSLEMAGAVSFQTPTPTEREMFLRNTDANCAGYALSDLDGPDAGNGCSFVLGSASIVPGQENTFVESYATGEDVAMPITLDASRPITGSIAISSVTPNSVIVEVKALVDGQAVGAQTIDAGLYMSSYIIESSPAYPFSIPIPGSLDKTDAAEITIAITWKRYPINAVSTWIELDDPASTVTIPAYSASFNRSVEVAVDGGEFSSTDITLSADLKSWSGWMATPALGGHFIRARAVQGTQVSGTVSHAINVQA